MSNKENLIDLRKDAIVGLLVTIDHFREMIAAFQKHAYNYNTPEDYDLVKSYLESIDFRLHNIEQIEEQIRDAGREP